MNGHNGFGWPCSHPGCDVVTQEPHVLVVDDEEHDVCPDHCPSCASGATFAAQEQEAKEHSTPVNPGDLEPGHGMPTREQSAAVETARRAARSEAAA